MSLLQANIDIEDAFLTYWASRTSVALQNTSFDPIALNVDEYIRFMVIDGDSNQASMGGTNTNVYRHNGIVLANVFTQPNGGARRCLEILDDLNQFFHSVSLSNITFLSPNHDHIGLVDGWFQKNILCDFYRDEDF